MSPPTAVAKNLTSSPAQKWILLWVLYISLVPELNQYGKIHLKISEVGFDHCEDLLKQLQT